MKVVILGKSHMLANLIEGVYDANSRVVGVFRYDRLQYTPLILAIRDFFMPANEVTLIKKKKIHEIKCKSANSKAFIKEILRLNADLILVGSWPEKLKKEIIDLPVIGTVNVHPSILPKYRGPNPYLQSIKNLEKKSGVTFHLMTEAFDKGPILLQKEIEILTCDTGKELKEKTVYIARALTGDLVRTLSNDGIFPVEQDEKRATYYSNVKPEEMTLDFINKTAEEIHAQIRAFHPWSRTYIQYKNRFFVTNPYKLEIIEDLEGEIGAVVDKDSKYSSLTVMCKDNKAIKMSCLKLYGPISKVFTRLFIKYFI